LDDFTNHVLTPIGTLFPACPSAQPHAASGAF
jgi:hypothetical protein